MPAAAADKMPTKPTYAVMVTESIRALGDRTGSSVPAIKKQLGSQYQIDATKINQKALTNAIKKGVQAGDFVQIKASYKLNKKQPEPSAAKKSSTATTKKASSTAASGSAAAVNKLKKKKVVKKSSKTSTKPKSGITKKSSTKVWYFQYYLALTIYHFLIESHLIFIFVNLLTLLNYCEYDYRQLLLPRRRRHWSPKRQLWKRLSSPKLPRWKSRLVHQQRRLQRRRRTKLRLHLR